MTADEQQDEPEIRERRRRARRTAALLFAVAVLVFAGFMLIQWRSG